MMYNPPLTLARHLIDGIDRNMAHLFTERMSAARTIGEYKIEIGLPIRDFEREQRIIADNLQLIADNELVPYYKRFLKSCILLSCAYQYKLSDSKSKLTVNTETGSYPIYFGRGIAYDIRSLFDFGNSKVLIVTDSGVPTEYVERISGILNTDCIFTFPQGEKNKNMQTVCDILTALSDNAFNRNDYILALGGGVVGDTAGFAASVYMRGIGFINMPTTLLAQVDSSVGGKTGVDLGSLKNLAGSFYQPQAVFIDYGFLDTLPQRQISNGIAECIKIAAALDSELFSLLETEDFDSIREEVIYRCIMLKRDIVELDEHENGPRRVLNFGHTLGHAFEYAGGLTSLLHGEAVALGMLPMCTESVRKRLIKIFKKYNLPVSFNGDIKKAASALRADKKAQSDGIITVYVDEIGHYSFVLRSISELEKLIGECFG